MNHDILKSVIFDQHEIIKNFIIYPREYSFEENANYVLTGMRRSGKSTLLYDIVQKLIAAGNDWNQIVYINFEDERLADFTINDFNDILGVAYELSNSKSYFFFDEIQNIEGWEKFARRLADAKERVYITGSNAKMLSRDIESTLGARFLSMNISPYNLREYLTALSVPYDKTELLKTKSNALVQKNCNEYLTFGGFPESLLYKSKREYVSSVYQKILLGDIIARNNIRNEYPLRVMMKKIAESVCSELSYTRLHNIVTGTGAKISKETVIDYVQYAIQAYMIFPVRSYYAKLADKESNPKYYFGDTGLTNLFLVDKDSALLENAVAVSMLRKYGEENLYYIKSSETGIDVDFWIPETKTAIQVCYSLNDSSYDREVKSIKKLASLGEAKRLVIVTKDESGVLDVNGTEIEIVPVYKFLLGL